MSTIARPSGQLPPEVYWRRRLVALGLLLLVLVVLGWLLSRLFGGGGQPGASPSAITSTATPSAKPSPTSVSPTPKQRSRKQVQVSVRLPAASGSCDPAAVRVTPAVQRGTHAGGPIALRLAISSTATSPCLLRISKDNLLVGVANANDTVWSSKSCGQIAARTVEVQPTWSTAVDVIWNGRSSGTGCSAAAGLVGPGPYVVQAAVLGGEPGKASFSLTARPAPKPTPAPTPSAPQQPAKSAAAKKH